MEQKIFFNSTLPRSGSTLLQNLIGQNPEFYVTPTSGLIDLMLGARIGYNQNHESKAGDTEMWRRGFYKFCKEGIKGYITESTSKKYYLDKNRVWAFYYNLLINIVDNPKILFMVRDLPSIFASLEKKFRANPDIEDGTMDNVKMRGTTTHKRVEHWAQTHPLGYSLEKLHQTLLDGTAANFLFVRYEDLCTNPENVMKSIYKYLDINEFKHDYQNIKQITTENDSIHGIYGDHIIRNSLYMLPNDSLNILGQYTIDSIKTSYRWYYDFFGYK
jgi:sulfotransferase